MPETINSWLFWLFIFLGLGCVAPRYGRCPPREKIRPLTAVSSLHSALQPFAAAVITGGSSGIGKSFIELGATLSTDLVFCNLSRRPPALSTLEKRLHHFPCDLSRS